LTAENETDVPSVPEGDRPTDDSAATPAPEAATPAESPTPAPSPEVPPQATPAPAAPPAAESPEPSESVPPVEMEMPPAHPPIKDDGRPTLIVRYGVMGLLGRFVHALEAWRCGQKAVIKSDRGQEFGTVLCKWDGCGAPEGIPSEIKGEILRLATPSDVLEEKHLLDDQSRELAFCRQRIAERNLPMKLVAVEHLFGGDRIVFYFLSETRVDFRSLVRDLAQEYRTRIEMRQIGVRDEARLLGDYERCGRPLCCRAWIKELQPVSMKMAKLQKATLDPAKISGRCGRLMCCLRFEDATYRELAKRLPRRNTFVRTTEGIGKVIDTDVVTQIVGVIVEGGKRINVPVEALIERDLPPSVVMTAPASSAPPRRDGRRPDRGRPSGSQPQTSRDRSAAPAAPAAPKPPQPPAPSAGGSAEPQQATPPAQPQPPQQPQQPGEAPREGRSGRRRRRRRRPRHGRRGDGSTPNTGSQPQGGGPSGPAGGGSPPPPASGPAGSPSGA